MTTHRWAAGRWRALTVPGAVLAVAVGLLTGVAPARAATPTVAAPVRVSATSAISSLNKSVVVGCPAGQRVYGAGGDINGGFGNVTLNSVTPNGALTQVVVTAMENGAFAGNWSVTAYAVCGAPTLNLQRIFFTGATNSDMVKTVVAGCPAGLRLYGLGGEINGGFGNVFFNSLTPSVGLTYALVTAIENGAYAGSWNVTGYAICGNPAATMVRTAVTSPTNSLNKSASAFCPAGTRVHGVGAELAGSGGNVVIDEVAPSAGLASATATGFENGPFAGNWAITSYAVCSS